MQLIAHTNIDKARWDAMVSKSEHSQLFMYSWYLDVVSPNWSALILNDYKAIFPLTEVKKIGTKQIIQPIFTREFNVIGQGFSNAEVLSFLQTNYQNISLRFSTEMDAFKPQKRVAQLIDLTTSFKEKYSTNAKRLIKKAAKHFEYKQINEVGPLMKMVKAILVEKIEEFTPENLDVLEKLMNKTLENHNGACFGVFQNNEFVGGGFFFIAGNRVTYLKGVAHYEAKRLGAMYGLMDFVFEKYSNTYKVFDFGGSNVENVAQFYKKFGAIDYTYFNYEIDQLPAWYKLSKKLFKK